MIDANALIKDLPNRGSRRLSNVEPEMSCNALQLVSVTYEGLASTLVYEGGEKTCCLERHAVMG